MNLRHSSLQVTLDPGTRALQSIGGTKPSSLWPLRFVLLTLSSSRCPPLSPFLLLVLSPL